MYILISIIIILMFYTTFYIKEHMFLSDNLVFIKSSIDNTSYWVRDLPDKSHAANLLALIKVNMIKLINHLNNNQTRFDGHTEHIKDLVKRTREIYIMETPQDESYTSYTVNKGEKIVICLRSRSISEYNKTHDLNTVMYVVIHELAHVACPEYGHTPLFKEIFKFLLKQSSSIGIYIIINYVNFPVDYCGMTINEYLLRD